MNPERIICIGDIHGDFNIFKKVLSMCNLIDFNGNWIGGNTFVVQLGDTLDGKRPGINISKEFIQEPGEVEIIKYILYIDSQARNLGGRVISILGNHELYPYYLKNNKNFIREYVKKIDIKTYKKEYNTDRIKFFQPGELGASLFGRTRPLILQLGEFIFIHGSLTDSLIEENIDRYGYVNLNKINKDTSNWLQGKGKIPSYLSKLNDDNPLFSRFYSGKKNMSANTCKKIKEQVEKIKDAKYVIMGHSSYKEINTTCDGSLIRIDVALSRAFGGTISNKKLQALEIIRHGKKPEINIISNMGKVILHY